MKVATDRAGPSDLVLVRRAGMGDRAAFTAIYEAHSTSMLRYAVHMLAGDVADAEDALQSAWIKAWQHLGEFRGESALRTWLFRITASEVHNARRIRRPTPIDGNLLEPTPDLAHRGPAQENSHLQLREALELALTELPWRQRASWLLFEVEGLSYQEIADVLDTSTTVVRGQLHRARATLAVRMDQWR